MNLSWQKLKLTRCGSLLVWTSIILGAVTICRGQEKAAIDPLDWPYWRGPEFNGISRETGLPETINPDGGEGSNLAWKRADLGGRSTPIVLRGKLYSIMRAEPATPTEGERVVCVDAASGKTIWESRHNVWSSDVPDTRVGWSSVVGDPETGNIYALGACGLFECYEGETGKVLWSIPLHEQMGLLSTYGGRTNYPVVFEDLVILGSVVVGWGDMAVPAHRIMGFNKRTGQIVWFVSTRLRPPDTIYSGPVIATIEGQKLLITGSSDGWVYALQPRTGKKVWEFQLSRRGLNVSPTVDGNVVYTGHSEANLVGTKVGGIVALNGALSGDISQNGALWMQPEMTVGRSSILKVGERLYCPDDAGKMLVLDAKTGEQIGRKISLGTINFASPLFADGRIYHMEKNGRWFVLSPDEKEGIGRFQRGKTMGNFPTGDECWASPVVSHGRLYIQSTGALYCFQDTKKQHGATPRPAAAVETAVAQDNKPAQLQVSPVELLLRPGEKQKLTARLFNSRGQFLKETTATFELQGPGSISEAGEFTAPADAGHAATIVAAKVGDLTTRARIRIVPKLPWKFDFEGLKDAPVSWVGARYRHVLRDVDGSNTMVKITTIPLGTRSRLSMGQSDLHDYTIQADFKAAVAEGKTPSVGVIAQGYTLEVSGANKWLKLVSWVPHDKRAYTVLPYQFEPDVWYTLKLRAENSAGKALLRGKIWKRGEPEPPSWTIELVDPVPNVVGAPGLFGDVSYTGELFLDNIAVTPN